MFPIIDSLQEIKHRPFWSVAIPTYNCTWLLESTLLSVIEQDPGPEQMQIFIVDDCSETNVALEIIKKLNLDNRIQHYQQTRNLGLSGNWNTCINLALGEVVHILHQDDIVFPGFYWEFENTLNKNPEVGAVFCRHNFIDDKGEILFTSYLEKKQAGYFDNYLDRIAQEQIVQTPAIAVRRSVYEQLGGFLPDLSYTLDWEMWTRIGVHYPIWYIPKINAAYRIHTENETEHLKETGELIRDHQRFYKTRKNYLPKHINDKYEIVSKRKYVNQFLKQAISLFHQHRWNLGFIYSFEAMKLRTDHWTLYYLLKNLTILFFVITKLIIKDKIRFIHKIMGNF